MRPLRVSMLSIALIGAIFVAGCTQKDDFAPDEVVPHTYIAEVVDFNSSPSEIEENYSKEGRDWLRMSFPDVEQRNYALQWIGREVPKESFTTLNNKEFNLDDISKDTIIHFAHTEREVTKEMASYIDEFQKEHPDIELLSIYPYEDADTVETFYKENKLTYNPELLAVGEENLGALTNTFDVTHVPTLLYVDKTQTVSYVAIGYRDAVFLQDHAETAFGTNKFYDFIQTNRELNEAT